MKFKLGITTALLTSLLAACGGDGNGAGTDAQNQANKLPIANADFFNVLQGNTATLNVLANDIDPELGALSLVGTPTIETSKGTITTSGDKKTLSLTLNGSFTGDITFSYIVADAQGNQTTGQATVTVKDLQSLSAKQDSTCVVTSTGIVKCWGVNDFGQLGDGTTQAFKNMPVTVTNLSGAKQVAMGYNHACAITQTGTVSCWGDNNNGQLGDGTQTQRLQATPVLGLAAKATQLALTYQSSCALLETGNIQCWGSNSQGELGVGKQITPIRSLSPQTLTLGSNLKAKRIVAGKNHLCAISQNDSLFCWGANEVGQLGINSSAAVVYQATQVNLAGSVQTSRRRVWP
ncbi:MAG: cadherin-like domain-containing protein [Moraxellaceae bacterium]|nr:cadherin-like domain-containing protein [Moraxellaceae bacterium]